VAHRLMFMQWTHRCSDPQNSVKKLYKLIWPSQIE
jgi:hypothetical protein